MATMNFSIPDDVKERFIDAPGVCRRAIDLAQSLGHHLFDTLYHAAALEAGAILITADRRYYDKAAHLGSITLLDELAA